uniref:Uncharacterized protein n=1 Tax=Clytia hemisphaerica TaxID=252671 RepID=A0A7M5WSN0_9CNID
MMACLTSKLKLVLLVLLSFAFQDTFGHNLETELQCAFYPSQFGAVGSTLDKRLCGTGFGGFKVLPSNSEIPNLWDSSIDTGLSSGPNKFSKDISAYPDLGYLRYNADENSGTPFIQTAFISPILDVSTLSTFDINFLYVVNGAAVGQLVLVLEYDPSRFDQITPINITSLKNDAGQRIERNVGGSNGDPAWKEFKATFDVASTESCQIFLQVIQEVPSDRDNGNIAIDGLDIKPGATEPATTQPATTQAPTTQPATTQPPTTIAPTTQPPTTQAPTTQPPTTQPPTTQPATTQPATTQAPTTQPPTTQPTTTQSTTTQPATTQAPTTQPPTTQPATTQPATTQPPSTQPATTQPATTQPPVPSGPIGELTEWTQWTECSVTCGEGMRHRNRTCENGTMCAGLLQDSEPCLASLFTCDLGTWTEWSAWTQCSGTCGSRTRMSTRECPNHGIPPCEGTNSTIVQNCTDTECVLPSCQGYENMYSCSFDGTFEKELSEFCNLDKWLFNGWAEASSTPSANTGPSVDATFNKNCGKFLYYEATDAKTGSALSAPFMSTSGEMCLCFSLSAYSKNVDAMGSMSLALIGDDHKIIKVIWDSEGFMTMNDTHWDKIHLNLPPLNTTMSYKLMFIGQRNDDNVYSFESDIAIDNINLNEGNCSGPIDGRYTEWSSWGMCDQACGMGKQNRTRYCTNPAPMNGGSWCMGEHMQNQTCKIKDCDRNGEWSAWTEWGPCDKSCGGGNKTRYRECHNPPPMGNGLQCLLNGSSTERSMIDMDVQTCNDIICDRDGGWNAWAVAVECSVECGNGTKVSLRNCTNPVPLGGGKQCPMEKKLYNLTMYALQDRREEPCYAGECLTVTTGWSIWSDWGECSAPCDDGVTELKQTRNRTCIQEPCPGNATQSYLCNLHIKCPVNGSWSEWQPLTSCSVSCGNGTKRFQRLCNNPAPANGGLDCPGDAMKTENCTNLPCPGNWTTWSSWECSSQCPNGTQYRSRGCTNPVPEVGADLCLMLNTSRSTFESECGGPGCCATNGTWVDVKNITSCSAECGVGNWTWEQVCTNFGCNGTDVFCEGGEEPGAVRNYTTECKTWLDKERESCRLHGGWKVVNETECSCASNQTKVVTRECIDPVPQGGGNWCENIDGTGNNDTEIFTKSCVSECHINGSWSGWVNTTICTSCGISDTTGVLNRTRYCNNPSALGNGTNCTDTERNVINQYYDYMYNVPCDDSSCPIPGNWSIWYNSSCDASCDTGYLTMERFCNDSAPVNDGDKCTNENGDRVLYESKRVTCNTHPCPQSGNWTEWTAWTVCDGTCGKDKNKTRSRECTNPPPENGGGACLKLNGGLGLNDTDSVSCGLPCCQQDAKWGNWSSWSDCNNSVPCTDGYRTRNRTCLQSECPNANVECPIFFQTFALNQTETDNCTQECVVRDGNWTNWTDWSNCSVACGGNGTSMRTRNCTGIENGGKECVDLHNTTSMYENQTVECYYFCRTPEDCTFDDGYCSNFTMYETLNGGPRRWLLDTDETKTDGTGPTVPQQGTHYAFFESSLRNNENNEPYYDDGKSRDEDKTESFSMSNIPVKYQCIGFYYFSWADDAAADNLGGTMGFLKVTENNNVILNHNLVDQSWKFALYNTTASAPFTLTFEGQALTRYSDHAIDDLRFYEVDCGTYQSMYKPIPSN